jgi:hypothetical protein
MLQRALELQAVCHTYCTTKSKAAKFNLSEFEWDKVKQMTAFLKPLDEVTKILCQSKYPTITMALPIYISLIKNIYEIRSKHDSKQLIPAADEMVIKLKKYLVLALNKLAPICAMVLDPRVKLNHFEKNQSFLVEHSISRMTVDEVKKTFV